MNIEQLNYIVEIAKTKSVSIAAQNLHTSQSAISKSVGRLEQKLDVKIFTRSRTGLQPTKIGIELINKAEEIQQKLKEFHDIVDIQKTLTQQQLKLASVPMFMSYLSQPLSLLAQKNPQINIEVIEKNSQEIVQDIKQDVINIGFLILTNDTMEDKELDVHVLLEARTYVCVNKKSPLSVKEYLTPEDLIDQRIVMYKGTMIKTIQEHLNRDLELNFSFETNNLDIIRRTIEESSSVSILSELTLKSHSYMSSQEIIPIPLVLRGQQAKMMIGWIRAKKSNISKIATGLLSYVKQEIRDQKI